MRTAVLVFALMLVAPAAGWADWQARPFIGVTLAGDTTFIVIDPTQEAGGRKKFTLGGSVTWLGDFIGVEGDLARVPGYFESESQASVISSHLTTLTGSVVLTLPRSATGYGLRPYGIAGGGVVWVNSTAQLSGFTIDTSLKLVNFGGGATGFVNERLGVNWDVRYFRSVGGKEGTGLAIGRERLSFWRASMGVVIRLGPAEWTP